MRFSRGQLIGAFALLLIIGVVLIFRLYFSAS